DEHHLHGDDHRCCQSETCRCRAARDQVQPGSGQSGVGAERPPSAAPRSSSSVATKWQIWRVANQDYPSSMRGHPPPANREVAMKASHWIIAAAAFVFAEPVQAGINDPEVIIYRVPGVLDFGNTPSAGIATSFHCTNFSGVAENIRFVTRAFNGG